MNDQVQTADWPEPPKEQETYSAEYVHSLWKTIGELHQENRELRAAQPSEVL